MRKQSGGDRGNSAGRRQSRLNLMRLHGNGAECPCHWCGVTVRPEGEVGVDRVERDRIVPGVEGGSYALDNLVPSCRKCNEARGDMPYEQYAKISKLRPERPEFIYGPRGVVVGVK